MKKKMLILTLAALLGTSMLTAGCGSNGSAAESTSSAAESTTEGTAESSSESMAAESSTEDPTEGTDGLAIEEGDATFDNVGDYLKLGTWQGIKITKDDSADYSSYGTAISDYMGYLADLSDQEAQLGNTVNLDYEGKIDGTAFDGGTATDQDLTLGSGTFIDDFENQLVGSKVGDTVVVNVTFPDDYSSTDLAGKDAEFTCKINAIYGSLQTMVGDDSTTLKYPKTLYDFCKDSIDEYYQQYADYYSMELQDLYDQVGITDETYRQMVEKQTKRTLVSIAICAAAGYTEESDAYKEVQSAYEQYLSDQSASLDDDTLRYNIIYVLAERAIVENAAK